MSTAGDLSWRPLIPAEPGYPRLLREISRPPDLEISGDLEPDAEMVAVVGSRRCSVYGEELAYEMAMQLAGIGMVVVSGLARGIDAAAHRGALDAGGRTIAVMGTGRDTIYPYEHTALARRIASQGALLTQFEHDAEALRGHFPTRNGTISGMCLGVVVVEARRRSGAMLTAGSAGTQGRSVMAVPGSVRNPNSRGCHDLIRDGARLVTSAEDVVGELRSDPLFRLIADARQARRTAFGDARDNILELLEAGGLTLDEVCDRTEIPPREVAASLARLRLDGAVELRHGVYEARR